MLSNPCADRLVLFAVTILVIAIVAIAILHWIAHLTVLGLMTVSINKVKTAAQRSLSERIAAPYLGGHGHPAPPPEAHPITQKQAGYIRFIHVDKLQDCAEAMDCQIYLAVLPGAFVHPGCLIAHLLGPLPKDTSALARDQ